MRTRLFKNPWTTITTVISIILFALVVTGFISGDEKNQLNLAIKTVIDSIQLSKKEEERFVSWCEREARARIGKIVGSKFRKSYHKAALLLKATSEMLAYKVSENKGKAFESNIMSKYPRHSAFTRLLK